MLNLEKHINDLLFLYECVIVPGLGGFVANKKSAALNEKTGVFTPPRREIGFNKSLSHNDGLLINHIAKAEGISFEDCNKKLAKHINILNFQLQKGENIKIGGAGELKNDAMGNTLFIPNQEESFSTESFGLTTFRFNTLEQIKEQNEPTRHLVRRTLQAKSTRQIAASISLILGLLFVTPEIGNQSRQSDFADLFPKIEQVSTSVTNDEYIESNTEVTKEEIITNTEVTPEIVEDVVSTKIDNSFFIIAGSFKEKKPAEVFLNKLRSKGIEGAKLLSAAKNRYRVSLEGFADKQLADQALENYREKNGFSSAWLLKI